MLISRTDLSLTINFNVKKGSFYCKIEKLLNFRAAIRYNTGLLNNINLGRCNKIGIVAGIKAKTL